MSLPTRPSVEDLTKLSKLRISTLGSTLKPSNLRPKKKAAPVADSWEEEADEDDGSDTETEADSQNRLSQSKTEEPPEVPPPTPISPTASNIPIASYGPKGEEMKSDPYTSVQPSRERGTRTPERRPDKTTSVAARLIAGGLGIRAPKKTEAEKEYEKAMKEKEKKRKDDERKAKDDEQKVKASVWED